MDDFDKLLKLFDQLPKDRQRKLLENLEKESTSGTIDTAGDSNHQDDDTGETR